MIARHSPTVVVVVVVARHSCLCWPMLLVIVT
jgi:hypothetical protein